MIQSLTYQKPISLLQQYEFTLDWLNEQTQEIEPYYAVVTVSYEQGKITIVDISVEGQLPENFADKWDPEWAVKKIHFELGEELNKMSMN